MHLQLSYVFVSLPKLYNGICSMHAKGYNVKNNQPVLCNDGIDQCRNKSFVALVAAMPLEHCRLCPWSVKHSLQVETSCYGGADSKQSV